MQGGIYIPYSSSFLFSVTGRVLTTNNDKEKKKPFSRILVNKLMILYANLLLNILYVVYMNYKK